MTRMRLVQPAIAIPRYRQLRMPVVAAEFSPYCDVEINDENIEKVDYSGTDIVGLTCQTYNAYRAFYISEQFRKRGVRTILGGVFATAMPGRALEHFDSVVVGEVEGLGRDIIDDLKKGSLKKIYGNSTPPDLSNTRTPRYDLLKNNRYYRINFPIETSRGCPHRCSFCFSACQYPTYRKRSLADIERDLSLHDHGMIEVIDLHFAADKRFLLSVCDLLKNMRVRSWFGEATLHSMDDDRILKALSDSNCKMVFVGLESISSESLEGINKGFNKTHEYRRIIKKCQDHGIFVHAGLMWGLDEQDESCFSETLEFSEEARLYLASNNLLTFFPGTRLFDEMRGENRIITDDFRDYDSAHITVRPDRLTFQTLLRGMKRFVRGFYSFRSIFKRAFQSTNTNLMVFCDYLGFNLLYRAYYKKWLRKVEKGFDELSKVDRPKDITVKPEPDYLVEKNSFPHLYNNIPFMYRIYDLIWRYWEFWFRKLQGSFRRPSLVFHAFSSLLYACGLVTHPFIHAGMGFLPVYDLKSPMLVFLHYLFTWTATVFMTFSLGTLRASPPIRIVLVCIATVPLLGFPLMTSGTHPILLFLMAVANILFLMKGVSYHASPGEKDTGFLRYYVYQAISPVLDSSRFFRIDFTGVTIRHSLAIQLLGSFQLLTAVFLFLILIRLNPSFLHNQIPGISFLLTSLVAGLYVYVTLAGLGNVICGIWKLWGFSADPWCDHAMASESPANFWSRFNTQASLWYRQLIFKPLLGRVRSNKPVWFFLATMAPFVISAIFLIYVMKTVSLHGSEMNAQTDDPLYALWGMPILAYFLLQGIAVYIQKSSQSKVETDDDTSSGVTIRMAVKIILTVTFIGVTGMLFFYGAYAMLRF